MAPDNQNQILLRQMNYWREDLASLYYRVADTDLQFSSISFFLLKIVSESFPDTSLTPQKKRCTEKLQSYRRDLVLLAGESRNLNHILGQQLPDYFNINHTFFSIPPQPTNWYWDRNTYNGVERLSNLLSLLGKMSEQLKNYLQGLMRACDKVCDELKQQTNNGGVS